MVFAKEYLDKAADFEAQLGKTPHSASETSDLRTPEQIYTTLAENEEWLSGLNGLVDIDG